MNLTQNDWWSQYLQDPNGVILDVRTEDENAASRIPESINIDFSIYCKGMAKNIAIPLLSF